jgi:hypothetical protein
VNAQLFVAQMEMKKEANSAFFYDFVVDEHGKLVYVFWADATSRKNYRHFGDLVSLDATYSINKYNMIFATFTCVKYCNTPGVTLAATVHLQYPLHYLYNGCYSTSLIQWRWYFLLMELDHFKSI